MVKVATAVGSLKDLAKFCQDSAPRKTTIKVLPIQVDDVKAHWAWWFYSPSGVLPLPSSRCWKRGTYDHVIYSASSPPPSRYSKMSEERLREDYFARFGVYPGH